MTKTAAQKSTARVSLTDQAYEAIKHRIVTTALAPGAYINEFQLSEELGIGRTPVHQALHRLAQEALVDILPRKGVMVRPVSLDEVAQIIEVRLVTEPFCTSQAALRVTQSALEEPKRYLDTAAAELEGDGDVEKLMELDCRFHAWIGRIANNQVMADILKQLQDRSSRFWFLSLSEGDHSRRVQEEHMAILQAIAARDPQTAADAARRHIESFRNTMLRVI
ncbi:GntR family transcriptional regulator [Amorphus sp. 3PC139-8]|uniref:GntR family transcriptional regulator n=1 Tax=Amorphus sp. 3PC139-8 TaxID=2735676 RepID=UPI00345D4098